MGISLTAGIVAVLLAMLILWRDRGQRANRLVALTLALSAHWSLCEVVSNASNDPAVVTWMLRLSGVGWLWFGPLVMEIFVELAGDPRTPIRRWIPVAYATSLVSIALYLTPWCIGQPFRTEWGWSYTFGPLFPLAYGPTMVWLGAVLLQWPRLAANRSSPSERHLAYWLFLGIGTPMIAASVTDVLLPLLGIHTLRIGSASVVTVGAVVAVSIWVHGYFLLAPGAFTHEILKSLRDAIALLTPDDRIQTANDAMVRLCKRPLDQLESIPIRDLIPALPADPIELRADDELTLVTESGETVPVTVSSSLLRDDELGVVGRVLVVRDLAEIANLRSRLITAGRLAAVGELAAGIAHEINNPITYVRSNLVHLGQLWETLAEEAEKTDRLEVLAPVFAEGSELFVESVEGIDRVSSIVRDVSEISHGGLGNAEDVNLNELLDNAINVAKLSFSVIVDRCYAELPLVRCNPQQLRQVLLNLLLNALQAVGDYGSIRLTTEASGEWVSVCVEDDGCGIAPESLERIFDLFYTTRSAGEGTGLGLALSYQIINNHGGEISVDSNPGVGTAFRVRLPRS
jgi:signal transduction histidine kinase